MTQKNSRASDRHVARADPEVGPTDPVYEEYDQGSQGPPNKPGEDQKNHAPTDTLGGQGGQEPAGESDDDPDADVEDDDEEFEEDEEEDEEAVEGDAEKEAG